MQKNKNILIFITTIIVSIVLGILAISMGSVSISFNEVLRTIVGSSNELYRGIVLDIRFPRVIAAFFIGGALALSGYLMQSFFRNPIAGPFVLGISSGSKLVVALLMIVVLKNGIGLSSSSMIFAAFIGALVCMGAVLVFSKKVSSVSALIVAGIMIGYICSAITDFVVTFADDADIVNLHNWSRGSFSRVTWSNIPAMLVTIIPCTLLTIFLIKPISAWQLGDGYARSVGVDLRFVKILLVLLSSILSGCCVAFAGPISFVGVATPHLVKRVFSTERGEVLIPGCFLFGGMICVFSDLIARCIFAPVELSVSTVTSFLLAPVVLFVIAKRRKRT